MSTTHVINDSFDWRTMGDCESTDLHFIDIEGLLDDGVPEDEAQSTVDRAEVEAKSICVGCPVRAKCLSSAMANDEEWGIWGGMTRAERLQYRDAWGKIKKVQGIDTSPSVQKDFDALHNNSGVNYKYQQRADRAQQIVGVLAELPGDWTLRTRKYGTHSKSEYLEICDLILRYPHRKATELADGLGRNATWFNDMFRDVRIAVGVQ